MIESVRLLDGVPAPLPVGRILSAVALNGQITAFVQTDPGRTVTGRPMSQDVIVLPDHLDPPEGATHLATVVRRVEWHSSGSLASAGAGDVAVHVWLLP